MSVEGPQAGRSVFPLRPLGAGEVLDAAVTTMRTYARVTLGPSAIVLGGSALLVGLLGTFVFTGLFLSGNSVLQVIAGVVGAVGLLAGQLFGWVVDLFAMAALSSVFLGVVSRAVLGRPAPLRTVWRDTKGSVGWLVLFALMQAAAITGLYFVVILPALFIGDLPDVGPYLVVLWMLLVGAVAAFLYAQVWLAPAAIVVERVNVVQGIARSWRMTATGRFRAMGVLLLVGLVCAVLWPVFGYGFGALALLLGQVLSIGFSSMVAQVLYFAVVLLSSLLVAIVVVPYLYLAMGTAYFELRCRAEGFDLLLSEAHTAGRLRDVPVDAFFLGPGTVFAGPADARPPLPPPGRRTVASMPVPPMGPVVTGGPR
ncbi:MAG: hypothetical protein GEV07_13555 [Streptosporangiales bacterium]|nr:hypothetical protein [Streptosporangiales bacterium]